MRHLLLRGGLCVGAVAASITFAFASVDEGTKALKVQFKRPKDIPYLDDNKFTKDRETLGKALFFDPRLSGSNAISCATCHNPSFTWTDGLSKGVGHGHKELGRKTPTIINLAWTERLMWDGRFNYLEGQALGPIGSEAEMNMKMDGPNGLAEKIKTIKGYQDLFAKAYPNQTITNELIGKAIAVYERGVVSKTAPFDKWIAGNEHAISDDAKVGFKVFTGKANCVACHSGWNFSDSSFQDIGIKDNDIGRGKFLKMTSQQHAFKTPGLRNIALRAPYLHNGSEATLEEVVEFYNRGGDAKRDSVSPSIKPLGLTADEKKALVAFLETLTSKDDPVPLPLLPK
jgi:cytochrome c peroxidase